MKKLLPATLVAAMAFSSTAALAQSYSYAEAFDRPAAAEAKVGISVPLGGDRFRKDDTTYGVSFGYSAGGQPVTEAAKTVDLAAFRLAGSEIDEARIGAFDFAQTEGMTGDGPVNGFTSEGYAWVWWGVGILALILLLDELDDDDYNSSEVQ